MLKKHVLSEIEGSTSGVLACVPFPRTLVYAPLATSAAAFPSTGSGQGWTAFLNNPFSIWYFIKFITFGCKYEIVMKEGSYMEYPAFYVAPVSGNLEWYLDMDATSWM